MAPKFKFNQYIVKKAREVEISYFLGTTIIIETDKVSYGVFKVLPYETKDIEGNSMPFDISYKVTLVPVGESAKRFDTRIMYTQDLWDIKEEMIFDDENLAEKFVKEFPI